MATTGIATVGVASITDVVVSGASTFTGVGTFLSDLYVGGSAYITGDLTFDEFTARNANITGYTTCLLYTSPSPRDRTRSRMPSSA